MARRTSKRRTSRRTGKKAYYLHYKTPAGYKKVKKLGYTKPSAGEALIKWKRRVRGKGYRVLKIFACGGGLLQARKLVSVGKSAKKRRSSRKRRRRVSRNRGRRRRSRRSSRRRTSRRRSTRRRRSRRPKANRRRSSRRRRSRRRRSRRRTSRRRRAG